VSSSSSLADREIGSIELPAAAWPGDSSVLAVLKAPRHARDVPRFALTAASVATLIQAALSLNHTGLHSASSALAAASASHDWLEMQIYAVLPDGAYRYQDRKGNLDLVAQGDLKPLIGSSEFGNGAPPVDLLYVADFARMTHASEEQRRSFAAEDAGRIAQHMHVVCACTGMATIVRGLFDRRTLAATLRLARLERIVLTQSVGYAT